MKIFRRRAAYSLFARKRNEVVLEDLKLEPVDEKLRTYKSNWLRHVTRINRTGCQNNAELQTKWAKKN
jgi:hypothetical protein